MSTLTDHNRLATFVPESSVPGLEPSTFREFFRHHALGVAVVTADAGDGPVAMTVTSLSSISAEPPLFIFSASAFSSSSDTIRSAKSIVVHLLDQDERWLAKLASTSGADRFSVPWHPLPTGEPVYSGIKAWMRGEIVATVDAGASTVIVAQAVESSAPPAEAHVPLVYHNRIWHAISENSRLD
ncbi:MAG: flavin reductase [Leucobacter sp.]|nr:flavin reductase [Leucobacter sp.]